MAEGIIKVGDKVRVSSPAYYRAGGTGDVWTKFYGQEVEVVRPYDSEAGAWTVRLPDGETNIVHQNYLTPVLKAGDKVQIADPAYTTPYGTGYVSPDFYGQTGTIVRKSPDFEDPGCWVVQLEGRGPGYTNNINEKYLTMVAPAPEPAATPAVDLSGFTPTPEQQAEIDKAVEEALTKFKAEASRIALERARLNGTHYLEHTREALREMGLDAEAVKDPSRRFTGSVTITVPFDVRISDDEWDGDDSDAEDYIRQSVHRSLDGVLFDSDLDELSVGSIYSDDISVSDLARVDEDD